MKRILACTIATTVVIVTGIHQAVAASDPLHSNTNDTIRQVYDEALHTSPFYSGRTEDKMRSELLADHGLNASRSPYTPLDATSVGLGRTLAEFKLPDDIQLLSVLPGLP
jgi:hypothetical protein